MSPNPASAEGASARPTLYNAPGACSLAVHIVLEWIGAPCAAVAVDQHEPAFRAIGPAGAVPALRLGSGTVLTQASAILHHLARLHPEAALIDEATPEMAAEHDRWSAFLTGDLHPAIFPVFTPRRYTVWGEAEALDAVRRAGLRLVEAHLGLLDGHLRGRTWMAGERRSVLDADAVPMLNRSAKLPGGLDAHPSIGAHHARMLADPVVRRIIDLEASRKVARP